MLALLLLVFQAAPQVPVDGPQGGRPASRRGFDRGAQSQPAPTGEPGTIQGRVLSLAGNPLKRTSVFLRKAEGRGQQIAITDAAGVFSFSSVEPGSYRLSADRSGFVRQEFGQKKPNKPGTVVTVAPRQEIRDLVFQLIPGAVITGRVIDEEGERMPNVRISLLRVIYQNGRRRLVPGNTATSNDLGEYRLFGIAPGRYYLGASASMNAGLMFGSTNRTTVETPSELTYGTLYYPNAPDSTRAVPIEIGAGTELQGIDFSFQPVRTVRVKGRVAGFEPQAQGPSRPVVMLVPRGDGSDMPARNHAEVDPASGAFELRGVIPGSYTLAAILSRDRRQQTARMPIEVGSSNIEGVNLVFPQEIQVAGRVRTEGAAGQQPAQKGVRILFEPVDGSPMVVPAQAAAAADGTFSMSGVVPDEYVINITGLGEDTYVKSAKAGNIEIGEKSLDLRGGTAPESLDITLAANGGRVDGAVVNDRNEPAAGATVVLIPEGARRSLRRFYKTGVSGEDGRIQLRGIPPGDYKLFAWEDIEPGAYTDPQFLEKYEARGAAVRIRENSAEALSLKLITE
jgi:protocatechuate 3,4-dioxygenase beta subunit